MKLSKLNIKKINIKDVSSEYSVQDILTKLGELYKFESGIYGYGNIFNKVQRKIENIIIEELDKADCIEVDLPKLQPKEVWEKSGRWDTFTKESDTMFTLSNNLGEYGLAPTAEECMTLFASNRLSSYKNLPATYYQIGDKFRKEIRTRGYLFRPRVFPMMDAYSFDRTEEDMKNTFNKMHDVYLNIFKRIGVDIIPVISDGGTMGGRISEEFQARTPFGEDTILYDEKNNRGLNKEVLEFDDKDTFLKEFNVDSIESLKELSVLELGNNFCLGTKYSKSMDLCFIDEDGERKPYYMGCYGIGVGRILAILLESSIIYKNEKVKGFSLPYDISYYKAHIIYTEENKEEAFEIYNKLLENNIQVIIDDREDLLLGNRINDVYMLGTPNMILLGNKYNKQDLEVEDTKTGNKELINKEEIVKYFKEKEMK